MLVLFLVFLHVSQAQEVLIRFMDRAVQFEQEGNKILVKYWLSLNEGGGIELHTVLEAMNVRL